MINYILLLHLVLKVTQHYITLLLLLLCVWLLLLLLLDISELHTLLLLVVMLSWSNLLLLLFLLLPIRLWNFLTCLALTLPYLSSLTSSMNLLHSSRSPTLVIMDANLHLLLFIQLSLSSIALFMLLTLS